MGESDARLAVRPRHKEMTATEQRRVVARSRSRARLIRNVFLGGRCRGSREAAPGREKGGRALVAIIKSSN